MTTNNFSIYSSTPLYASVILPIKFGGEITYTIPNECKEMAIRGARVTVDFAGKIYDGVISEVSTTAPEIKVVTSKEKSTASAEKEIIYKPILSVEELPLVSENELKFWEQIADYYLCTIGEVFKAAYPAVSIKQEGVKPRKTLELFLKLLSPVAEAKMPDLSVSQNEALNKINSEFYSKKRAVLLKGVTGSGKTEIYIHLAQQALLKGENVLYMVPEIALSKQLFERLKKIFGERLLIFHSKQTAAARAHVQRVLTANLELPVVVLGTRSSLFLPFKELGLIIVDEEHDSSYKQTEPAPRYHAKDSAIMLAALNKSKIVLGSATPSFESEYNCAINKFAKVELNEKFYGGFEAEVEIVNTIYARKTKQMKGSFSQKLINEIKRTIDNGNQVIVFRNRRSYSPIVECTECGTIPKCPHCNVHLSYHKFNNTLRCHYCEYITTFNGICPTCGLDTVRYKGAGTEKLEEELKELLPHKSIARYDTDIAKSKQKEEQVIRDFSNGEIDVLVGTQMITKGFDFEKLKLVAVIQTDTLLGIQDFRADERAIQLLSQLMGRAGRRGERGKLIIQSSQKEHPVFYRLQELAEGDTIIKGSEVNSVAKDKEGSSVANSSSSLQISKLLAERKEFDFPPFVRMVKIIVKHTKPEKLDDICKQISATKINCIEVTGPFAPPIDKVRGEYIKCFYVKFARNLQLTANKHALLNALHSIKGGKSNIVLDVDPC